MIRKKASLLFFASQWQRSWERLVLFAIVRRSHFASTDILSHLIKVNLQWLIYQNVSLGALENPTVSKRLG